MPFFRESTSARCSRLRTKSCRSRCRLFVSLTAVPRTLPRLFGARALSYWECPLHPVLFVKWAVRHARRRESQGCCVAAA